MKVLITGATGLIGKELVKLCHEQDYVVHYLTTTKSKLKSKPNYKGFYWDPEKNVIDAACFNGVEVIINLAGAPISKRWTASYKKTILNSRLDSLKTLYACLEKHEHLSVKRIISASAIGIYPNSLENFYKESNTNIDDSFLGRTVRAWENKVLSFKELGLNVAKIRIGLVLSEKGGALQKMAKPIDNYIGAAFGSGQQWQSWIHIEDLARIFMFVLHHDLKGTYNAVAPNPITNQKLIKEIAKVLQRPVVLPNIPKFLLRLVLGEMCYLLLVSQRVSSKKIEEAGFVFKYQNICSALKNIFGDSVHGSLKPGLRKEYA